MRKLFYLFAIAISTLFVSCEGNTDRARIITNVSSGSIRVQGVFNQEPYDKLIEAGYKEIIFVTNQRGGSDFVEDPAQGVSLLVITNEAGDTCLKDYKVQDNWSIKVKERTKVPSDWQHEYRFIVVDSDF